MNEPQAKCDCLTLLIQYLLLFINQFRKCCEYNVMLLIRLLYKIHYLKTHTKTCFYVLKLKTNNKNFEKFKYMSLFRCILITLCQICY